MVLAAFDAAGLRWWTGALASTLGVFFAYLLGRDLFSDFAGRVAAVLLATNEFFITYGTTYMPHGPGLARTDCRGMAGVPSGGSPRVATTPELVGGWSSAGFHRHDSPADGRRDHGVDCAVVPGGSEFLCLTPARMWRWWTSMTWPGGVPDSLQGRRWIVLCLGLPVTVMTGAFVWLAIDHRDVRLWNVVVHESGRYTLGQTIFYFSHFLREIPTVFAMALFLVSASSARIELASQDRKKTQAWAALALLASGVVVVVALAQVSLTDGAHEAVQNLIQVYTRDDVQAYGSHWRFHLLSTIWFGLAVPVTAWIGFRFLGGPPPGDVRNSRTWRAAWFYFLALTIVFGVSLEPILDPRFIGHQAREILTHAITTLPLGLGLLAIVQRFVGAGRGTRRPPWRAAAFAGVVLIPAYLGIAVLATDAMATGQTERGLAAVVAAHFFEHSLDFVLISFLVVGLEGVRLELNARGGRPERNVEGDAR